MTVFQIVGFYLFSTVYTIIPFVIWSGGNEAIEECSPENTLGKNSGKAFAFLGIGLFLPITILNVLYFVTSCKLRKHWRKRLRSLRQKDSQKKSLAKESHSTEVSILSDIEQHRRAEQVDKIRCYNSPKPRLQVQRLTGSSRSAFHDSLVISDASDGEESELNVKSSFVGHHTEKDESFNLNTTHLGLMDTLTSSETKYLGNPEKSEDGTPSIRAESIPKCENTNLEVGYENVLDLVSTRGKTFQRGCLSLIGATKVTSSVKASV